MLLLLPFGFQLLTFLHLAGSPRPGLAEVGDWRRGFLLTTVLSGVIVAVSAELLSLLAVLNRAGVALVWGVATLGALWIGLRKGSARAGLQRVQAGIRDLHKVELAIIAAMIALALLLLLVAWVSPPNNVDSLIYHMSKVVHWAQNESLRHYAAINHAQLIRPPWAEMGILHLRTLFGSDRPANLVQWFSMVGSVVAVSGITGLLGGNRKTQLLASAAAFSVPMGVLQSTSTQNDYAAALWAMILAYFVVLSRRRALDRLETVCLASTVGLGMLTKGTFFVYATPFLLWLFIPWVLRRRVRLAATLGASITVAAVVLNSGFWARNIATYGGPYGPVDALQRSLGIIQRLIPWISPAEAAVGNSAGEAAGDALISSTTTVTAALPVAGDSADASSGAPEAVSQADDSPPENAWAGLAAAAATEIRMAAWNLITPSSAVNAMIRRGLQAIPSVFDEGYLVLIERLAWNHEDTAGNPMHLVLFVLSVFPLAATSRRLRDPAFGYFLAVLAAYLLLPFVASVAAGPWGVRYQLPFFVLAGPVIALGVNRLKWPRNPELLSGLFVLAAVPYMLFNNTRPVVGRTPWPTRIGSVFTTPSADILLAMSPEARTAFIQATDAVTALGCKQVGLRIDSGDLEYALWWLLAAPQSNTRIEVLYPLASLEGLVDRAFEPCALVCSICGEDREALNGLPRVSDYGVLKLYAGTTFTWQ